MPYATLTIFTDGGSRGNPGPAAWGFSIVDDTGREIAGVGNYIGENTNNVAEYTAVIESYNWLLSHKDNISPSTSISFFMDSELVCKQLNGLYKVKHPSMQNLYLSVKKKEDELGLLVTYTHVRRENNKRADSLVNQALDECFNKQKG